MDWKLVQNTTRAEEPLPPGRRAGSCSSGLSWTSVTWRVAADGRRDGCRRVLLRPSARPPLAAQGVPRPIVGTGVPLVRDQLTLRTRHGVGHGASLEMGVESRRKLTGTSIIDAPERRDHVGGPGGKRCLRQREIHGATNGVPRHDRARPVSHPEKNTSGERMTIASSS